MSSPRSFSSYFGGIGRALSNPLYRRYWSGQVFMVQGVWIHKIAAGWLIYDITRSPIWLGAIGLAYFMPLLVLGPIAGAISDRFGPRRLSIVISIIGGCIAAGTAVITWMGLITPLLLVILITFQGMMMAIEFPARQSLYPRLLNREDLPAAVATNNTTFYASAFTGPLIGGLILNLFGAFACFAANAIVISWMATVLIRLKVKKSPRLPGSLANLYGDLKEGLTYTFGHTPIKMLILMSFFAALFIRPYMEFLPGIAVEVFKADEQGLAYLMAASGVGGLAFAAMLAVRGRMQGLIKIHVYCQFVSAILLILFTITENFSLGLAALALTGGFAVASSIGGQSLIQHMVDERFRGRTVSLSISLGVGGLAIGAQAVGWIAEYIGMQGALKVSAVILLLMAIIPARTLLSRKEEIESATYGDEDRLQVIADDDRPAI